MFAHTYLYQLVATASWKFLGTLSGRDEAAKRLEMCADLFWPLKLCDEDQAIKDF